MYTAPKGGLISELFSLWHKFPNKGSKSLSIVIYIYILSTIHGAHDNDFLEDLSQCEKLSDIKPPLARFVLKTNRVTLFKILFSY